MKLPPTDLWRKKMSIVFQHVSKMYDCTVKTPSWVSTGAHASFLYKRNVRVYYQYRRELHTTKYLVGYGLITINLTLSGHFWACGSWTNIQRWTPCSCASFPSSPALKAYKLLNRHHLARSATFWYLVMWRRRRAFHELLAEFGALGHHRCVPNHKPFWGIDEAGAPC